MRVEVVPSRDLSADVSREWLRLQGLDPELASPYFSPEFTKLVGEVRDDAFVAIFEESNRIAALFPFQRKWGGIGIPIGGPVSDYQGIICDESMRIEPRDLIRESGLNLYQFDHLLASQRCFEPFHRATSRSLVIDLTEGFEAYESRKHRTSDQLDAVRRKARKLAREVGPLRYERHAEDPSVLSRVLAWKSEQSERTGTERLFDHAWARALVERIHATRSSSFAGVLSALWAGDELVAAHMGMRSRTVWHYWFPTYNAEFGKYAPGLALLLEMAKDAANTGIRAIDLGKGEQRYKSAFANAEIPLAEGFVSRIPYAHEAVDLARASKERIRKSSLYEPARVPARLLRQLHVWALYR